ncbi:aspartate kinase [Marinomonas mediterranea]|jgi:Aspartokinases|uniref:aspartate kinase n=1 Tax=Marinomonas mediterranea (strain ATCC 700492 / JCM 21426 / NBRC 103028 / MMB-1) TaxID=717774 RepID=F2JTB5_MARM1|nr:aspartate kinase [Marinomonas mediterranea]ADZ90333.1 amino acid-binding ACT domain protein [Marinomonas mediterranea MMB-1]WCN08390.1 aspartate kinase [Marinomonas mediterranea]WCN12446.1 aspartate kinase [Marinomonas mediterranea]WCN16519.1 aspartate kinase [Marinomonas mediterranea MMB-1]
MALHTVEKIGGTSMSDYRSVRDNIIFQPSVSSDFYNRIFVVSAYGGITDKLLEHKKTGDAGVYAMFAKEREQENWLSALQALRSHLEAINLNLFGEGEILEEANHFVGQRLEDAQSCLEDLNRLCNHGHFAIAEHLATVREMLASIGEAHSAWNMARLLKRDGVNAVYVDLTGWQSPSHMSLDERIVSAFEDIDLATQLPITTGYAHSETGLMSTFDRGYSEMTFSRIAVLTHAKEAIIHKEFHLSSADPRLVGEGNAVPIGRTNYDVADQLANLGMEAIHPKAAKGLRQNKIALRVKNTFEPEHTGTLITGDYVSDSPCVEIIAGCRSVYAIEVFDQEMTGDIDVFDTAIMKVLRQLNAHIIAKDINANTITHYLGVNLKNLKRIMAILQSQFSDAEISQRKVAIVSAIGSDMKTTGMLAKAVKAIAEQEINVIAMHQSMRQVDMQFVVDESDFEVAIKALHKELVEVHEHGRAICLAS